MNILVVSSGAVGEDRRDAIAWQLAKGADHTVVVLSSYEQAMQMLLSGEKFTVVLLDDLMMAEGNNYGCGNLDCPGQLIPVGYPLAIKMALLGVGFIAVIADKNRQNYPDGEIMSWLNGTVFVHHRPSSKIVFFDAPVDENGARDYLAAFNMLMTAE